MTRRFQFSLKWLLVSLAAVAVVLALMFQAPPQFGVPALGVLVMVALAMALTGLVYSGETWRPFCIGAMVPLSMMSVYVMVLSAQIGGNAMFYTDAVMQRDFGSTLLVAMSAGFVCVVFRGLIEPRR